MLNSSHLKNNISSILKANDFKEVKQNQALAKAIAEAVVTEIKQAVVEVEILVASGSSAGNYKGQGVIK